MTINSGSSTGVFRIGVDSSISVLKVVIKFTHSISGYIPLRPIYLWIDRYYSNKLILIRHFYNYN